MTDTPPLPRSAEDPLDKMPIESLMILRGRVDRAISAHHHRRRIQETEAEREELEAQAREGRPATERTPRAPRSQTRPAQGYRHPEDPSIVWPGLGRRPAWLHKALDRGLSLEDLAIPVTETPQAQA